MANQTIPVSERTCPIEMSDGKPCGRPVHQQRWTGDPDYVCLMHTHDPNKEYGSYSEAFEQELSSICDGSSIHNRIKNKRDYQGFVFFKSKFSVISLAGAESNFAKATFANRADFSNSVFDRDVDFTSATFRKGASFEQTRFQRAAVFAGASFGGEANFGWTSFGGKAQFYGARFGGEVNFAKAKFSEIAKFDQGVFEGTAYFGITEFLRDADFVRTTFSQAVEFGFVDFSGILDLRWAGFKDPTQAVFHRINNKKDGSPRGLRLRLNGCLLEGVRFEDVNWDRKDRRIYLQDETDLREVVEGNAASAADLGAKGSVLTHEVVADAYRRLVNNFEKSRQYEWAEECFLGEMEMRRCNPRLFLLGNRAWGKQFYLNRSWARWIGENVSLISVYRWLSKYGSSYSRALGVLMGFIILFAVLLPALGLRMPADSRIQATCPSAAPTSPEAAVISWACALKHQQPARQLVHTFDAGLWDAMEVAVFQKNRTVEPATAGGRRLENSEMIVVPGQFALLLLAIRRRFRR